MTEVSLAEAVVGIIIAVIVGLLSGFTGALVGVKVLNNDIKWITKIIENHSAQIGRIHKRIDDHVTQFHQRAD